MNWLTDLFWDIRFKIEDVIFNWKNKAEIVKWDKEDSMDFTNEELEVKPKKKKKSVKKAKKSV